MKRIKFGICEWSSPIQGPYVCKLAADLGLDGIELLQGDYSHSFPTSNPYIQNVYLEEAAKYGIEISAIAVNCLDDYSMTASDSAEEKQIALLAIKKAVETAKQMKLPLVQIPSFGKSYIQTESQMREVAKCLQYACDLAAEYGIQVATENPLSAEGNLELLQYVGRKNLKIYLDTQNPYLRSGCDVPEMIRILSDKICEVHVKDGADGELSAALLGRGATSYFRSVEALCEIGYTGFVHLENYYDRQPMNHCDQDAVELLKEDIAILKQSFMKYNGEQ